MTSEITDFTFLMSSTNAFLSPLNLAVGPEISLLAETLSSFRDDRQRAKTASPLKVSYDNSL